MQALTTKRKQAFQIPEKFASIAEKRGFIAQISAALEKAKGDDAQTLANKLAKARETTVARKPKAVA
jgi:hypothetical protein